MAAYEYIKVWLEPSWGTFTSVSPGVNGTDWINIEINQSNAFTMRTKPVVKQVQTGTSGGRIGKVFSTQSEVMGNLQTYLYPSQTSFFMNWIAGLSSNELPSCSIDHCIVKVDSSGTSTLRRYLGVKVEQAQLSCSGDDPALKLNLTLRAKQPTTLATFAEPAATTYPTAQRPFCHQDLSGGGLVYDTTRANFTEWGLTIDNTFSHPWMESQYISFLNWRGRKINWTTKLAYVTDADRTTYEAVTAKTCTATFNNGTNSILFDFKGANYLGSLDDDISFDNIPLQSHNWTNTFDSSSSTDFSFTYS